MSKWLFEPGHTAAEFRARRMMVTYVRGQLKNVHGFLEVDPDEPEKVASRRRSTRPRCTPVSPSATPTSAVLISSMSSTTRRGRSSGRVFTR
ncbi:hypothetical protein ACIGBH_37665 [Streptomyces sp. NPDC085929]|uniref:hypothetical protein n=1 Tax=Streptomyces sp. NPDC085929 TaxID=3365739 RepID=UPI0037D33A3F